MEGLSRETETPGPQLTPGPDVTDIGYLTSGHVSHCVIDPADNPPYGNTSHISCVPTPNGLLTNDPGNPHVRILQPDKFPEIVRPGSFFTIGDT